MENITPKQKELLDYVMSTENLHKHLRKVYFHTVQASSHDGIEAEICNSLAFVSELSDLMEEVVSCKS